MQVEVGGERCHPLAFLVLSQLDLRDEGLHSLQPAEPRIQHQVYGTVQLRLD